VLSALVAAAVFALAAAPSADARAKHISLSLPSSAAAGARVAATGRVAGIRRGPRVFIQARTGRRWTKLAGTRVSHHRFRAVFIAPSHPVVLIVRAVIYIPRHRPVISRSRRIAIRAPNVTPLAPATAVAGWGDNNHAQLGGGFKNGFNDLPAPVLGLTVVKAVAATYFSSYALLTDGTVRAWGGNLFGQLGDGTHGEEGGNPVSTPVSVKGLTNATAIAVGGAHAMALLSDGTVATWGGNAWGELGNGTTLKGAERVGSDVPLVVPGLSGVVAIAAGGGDDAALLGNGTVVAWGENKQGQLGDGTKLEKDVPTPVRGLTGVKAVAVGGIPSLGGHMLALLNDGTVRAIGGNGSGQLGDGSTTNSSSPVTVKGLSGVTAVSAAVSHSVARLASGDVVSWGNNAHGELGVASGPELCGKEPEACSRVPVSVGLTNVSAISAGFRFSLAVSGGRVFAWGTNELGQLGNGTNINSSQPVPVSGLSEVAEVAAGEKHSLALLHERGPAAPIELLPGVGSLTVSWRAGEGTEPWTVSWRPLVSPVGPWGPYLKLPPATRSYTITGLSPRRYEVLVRNKTFRKIAIGTPLG
jgi:alpha-tubulin suppressor-like RCC1 family protein